MQPRRDDDGPSIPAVRQARKRCVSGPQDLPAEDCRAGPYAQTGWHDGPPAQHRRYRPPAQRGWHARPAQQARHGRPQRHDRRIGVSNRRDASLSMGQCYPRKADSAWIGLTQRIVMAAPANLTSTRTDHALDASSLRRDYRRAELLEAEAGLDPFVLFRRWFNEALEAGIDEPNALALSTVMASGRPTSRIVLLKGADTEGFVFFTNYESSKGRQIAGQDAVSMLFFWAPLERQIRIEGYAVKLNETESDAYFRSRPLGSRIGAWASPQSQIIESREVLEDLAAHYQARFGDNPPRPPHWGGYRVVPDTFEFWQGRSSRLHDRLRYRREAPSAKCAWQLERLAP